MEKRYLIVSEAVTEGHPDKVCDKISDKILDSALEVDPDSRMAVEATIKDDLILIYGEANTKANLDYEKIAKFVMKDIGYNEEYNVLVKVSEQSSEINEKVNKEKVCAGDQGIMFGYASNETKELMPLPIMLANKLAYRLTEVRKSGEIDYLCPDGKTQVAVEYLDGKVLRVDHVVVATQHLENIDLEFLRKDVLEKVVLSVIDSELIDDDTKILINASGSFVVGGSFGDSGTTGRKIVVDTYGGVCPVGGGCFSSKDSSKVDRSAAYYARYVCKNIVGHGLCDKCQIQVSYVIGFEKEFSIYIDTFGTEKVSISKIYDYVRDNFDFSVDNIIKELDLKRQIYYNYASYGHFGREASWEKIK